MRYLPFVLFTISTFFLRAQEIPKKATAIVVKGVSFDQVLNGLVDQNYFIDKKDDALKTVVTIARHIDQSSTEIFKDNTKRLIKVIFYIRVRDSVANISGQFNDEIFHDPNYDQISYRGAKGSAFMLSWDCMNDFAKSLKGEISYIKP